MKTPTQTPSPWRLEIVDIPRMQGQWRIMGNGEHNNSLPHGGNWVGTVARSNGARGLANVRLIAAAPEMLDALKTAQAVLGTLLQSDSGTYINATRQIDAAIAKAEGHA